MRARGVGSRHGRLRGQLASGGRDPGGSVRSLHAGGVGRQFELELVQQLELQLVQQLELELEQQLVEQLLEELAEPVPVAASIAAPLRRRLERVGARPRGQPRPHIEFLCELEDRGVIAEPVPAKTVQPAWFKKLPGIDRDALTATNNGLTVKRCVPFLDAMTLGWIVPLAATVRLEISDDGKTVSAGWEFDRQMVSHHNAA